MTLVDGPAPTSSQAAGIDVGGPCVSRLYASVRHPPSVAGRLCEHYILNRQQHPHVAAVYAFHYTRQSTVTFRAFCVLPHGVARATQSADFRTASSKAAHGNHRMPFCALVPCYQTPPSLSTQLCRDRVGAFPLRILALVSLAQLFAIERRRCTKTATTAATQVLVQFASPLETRLLRE